MDIATLPLGDIREALRHDGHPPLYYLLLHLWTEVVGTGDVAVRALSGVLSVLTPPGGLDRRSAAGRRHAGLAHGARAGGPALRHCATPPRPGCTPWSCSWSSSAGWPCSGPCEAPRLARLALVALVSGALLLTHYWAFYLVGATGLVLVVSLVAGGRARPARFALG